MKYGRVFRAGFPAAVLFLALCGCQWMDKSPSPSPSPEEVSEAPSPSPSPSPEPYIVKDPEGDTLETRFLPPEGFTRDPAAEGSFAEWLRALPLKPDGQVVYLYDGTIKPDDRFDAVVKMDINTRDFMRNTNFLLRLRGEYLYHAARFSDITFHFLSGFEFGFSKWAEGNDIKVDVSKVSWTPSAANDGSYESFRKYLNNLFIYSNSTAIKQDLLQSTFVQAGCVFTANGGAVVADTATGEDGRTAVILCRGGDPEQEGYVVRNTGDPDISPWFILPENGILKTPEGDMSVGEIYMFR